MFSYNYNLIEIIIKNSKESKNKIIIIKKSTHKSKKLKRELIKNHHHFYILRIETRKLDSILIIKIVKKKSIIR